MSKAFQFINEMDSEERYSDVLNRLQKRIEAKPVTKQLDHYKELNAQLIALASDIPNGEMKLRKLFVNFLKDFSKGVSESDFKVEKKKAADVLQKLLDAFKSTGHAFEVLGSSDELMKVDSFRDMLKSLIKKGK